MAATRPKNLKFTNPELKEGKRFDVGDSISIEYEGDYRNPGSSRFVHVMIRVFYRINGVPHSQILHSDEAVERASGSPDFKTRKTPLEYTPQVPGVHTLRILAWDSKLKPEDGKDVKTKTVTIQIKQPS